VTWVGVGAVQADEELTADQIKPQMFRDAPVGPSGGRPAQFTERGADGRKLAVTGYSECLRYRVEYM